LERLEKSEDRSFMRKQQTSEQGDEKR